MFFMLRLVRQWLIGFCCLSLIGFAMAQDTGRPMEWVVGYAAGGGSDVVARTVASEMSRTLARSIVIINKPGAATNIAADYVARSKDYGDMLLTADFATLAANPALFSKLSYNAEKDFASVGLLARFPLILIVSPRVPAKNYKEFLAWAKAHPNDLTYGSAGAGSPHHLTAELLAERMNLKLTHVPYRGAAPAIQDVMSGHTPFMFADSASCYQFITAGKVQAIGVASASRMHIIPDLPTLAEQGLKGFEAYAWQGVSVPAGTPSATIKVLNQALNQALNSTVVKARFQILGIDPLPSTPEQMTSYARTERERWGRLIRANNIRIE